MDAVTGYWPSIEASEEHRDYDAVMCPADAPGNNGLSYRCTRRIGHTNRHEAAGVRGARLLASWPQEGDA